MIEIAKPWIDINPKIIDPVRNTNSKYLKFLNTQVFNEDARYFLKHGYYCNAPVGTKDYDDYWSEQENRCLHGYSVGGVRITGRHYFMINFGLMKARPMDPVTGKETGSDKKIITFPRFLDHQYYLFNEFEECFAEEEYCNQPLQGIICAKGRRKGVTYVNAAGVLVYNYNFLPSSNNILCAYETSHYKVTMDAVWLTVNHLNKTTDFAKRRLINQRDYIKSGFKYQNDFGQDVEDGYLSEIRAMSFKDNEFRSIGESCTAACFEEGGKFSNLIGSYTFSEPTWKDGDIMTGVPVIWGTGGDMSSGSVDFAEMFYNPKAYGLKAYDNIYDDNAVGECGYFIDHMWYYPGKGKDSTGKVVEMVDDNGNSIREVAESVIDAKRVVKKKGTSASYQKYLTQEPKSPQEAFMRVEGSVFDAINAQTRLGEIQSNPKQYIDSIHVVKLNLKEDGRVVHEHCDNIFPIREFPLKNVEDTTGAIEIYEMPVFINGVVPGGVYISGLDPYSSDQTKFSNSLGSCLVMNRITGRIVAEYTARPTTTYEYFENARRLLLFYNASCNYEHSIKGMFPYFERMNSAYLLCDMPQFLRDQQITKVEAIGNSAKGTPGSEGVNAFARDLIIHYCSSQAYDREPGVTNMFTIRSIGLLKELISWNKSINADRVSALGMLLILKESLHKYQASYEQEKSVYDDDFFKKNDSRFERRMLGKSFFS